MVNLAACLMLPLGADNVGSTVGGAIFFLIELVIFVVIAAGSWKTFQKAGQPGWGVLIPIYNVYLMMKIAGRPGWWVILMFIPLVNIIIMVLVSLDIAKSFGKSAAFGVGLFLLSFIFYPILGFGDAQYQGPVAMMRSA
jgi:Family of unknown function (DUF5684)